MDDVVEIPAAKWQQLKELVATLEQTLTGMRERAAEQVAAIQRLAGLLTEAGLIDAAELPLSLAV